MRRSFFVVVFAAFMALLVPLSAGALGLDVEANAGAGLGLGSTNNPNNTGSARFAFQGGIETDFFLLNAGPVALGLSTGLEYDNLTNHGTVKQGPSPFTVTFDSDNTYQYLIIPFALTSRIPLSESILLSLRAGGFYGFFLGGKANNITQTPGGSLPATNLDSTNTPSSLIGLHFSGGVDVGLGGGFFLSPSVIFNMGLTNISGTSSSNYTSTVDGKSYVDSVWSLDLMVGLKYNVF